jgi:S1-C subfamily serine protease
LKLSYSLNPGAGIVPYLLGCVRVGQDQIPEALFYFARVLTFQGAYGANTRSRQALQDYLEREYVAFHGNEEGLPQVMEAAKAFAAPPAGFTIRKKEHPTVVSTGTGFVINRQQHILTNYHVVEGCSSLLVTVKGRDTPAILVAKDAERDLAVVQIDPSTLVPLAFPHTSQIMLGQTVIAMGFPFRGLLASSVNVTTGTVSSVAGIENNNAQIQITAAVQPGNSGGPLLDETGTVIGIVVSKLDSFFIAKMSLVSYKMSLEQERVSHTR